MPIVTWYCSLSGDGRGKNHIASTGRMCFCYWSRQLSVEGLIVHTNPSEDFWAEWSMICAASQPDAVHVKWNMPWIRCWKDHCGSRKTNRHYDVSLLPQSEQPVKFLRWRNVFREKYFLHMLSVNSFKMFLNLRIVRHWQVSVYFVCFKHVVNTDSRVIHCPPKQVHKCPAWDLQCTCKSTPRCWVSQWEHVAPSPLSPRNSIETWAFRSFVSTFPEIRRQSEERCWDVSKNRFLPLVW